MLFAIDRGLNVFSDLGLIEIVVFLLEDHSRNKDKVMIE